MAGPFQRVRDAVAVLRGKPPDAALGYPGIQTNPNVTRRPITTRTKHELYELPAFRRQAASGTVRDQRRAFGILAWMIRKAITNTSNFTPHVDTGDEGVDRALRLALDWHALPENFDAMGRMGRDEWFNAFEGTKIIAGDCGGVKVQGLKMQGIEGDRIGVGQGVTLASGYAFFDGHWVSEDGLVFEGAEDPRADVQTIQFGNRVVAWAVCRRTGIRGSMLTIERLVPAENFIFDAYWADRFDNNRGASPILPVLNQCADYMEAKEFILLKIKIVGLFGFGFERAGEDELATKLTPGGGWGGNNSLTGPGEASATEKETYEATLARAIQARSPYVVDMDPGDKVHAMETSTPNPDTLPYLRDVAREILLALDLPFTMLDSLGGSYSANEQARNEFDEACAPKRKKNRAVMNRIYSPDFVLGGLAAMDVFGLGKAMRKAGMTIDDVRAGLDWYASGRPQPTTEEIKAGILSFASGTDSPQRFCARHATDHNQIRNELKKAIEDCKRDGVPLFWTAGGQASIQQIIDAPAVIETPPKAKA